MDHDALRRTLIQDVHRVGPCLPDMDDDRLARLVRKGDVGAEHADLIVRGRKHPEPVEAALPHGNHARVVQELLDPARRSRIESVGIVGVNPCGREHTLECIGDLERSAARFDVHTDADQPLDAGGLRGLDRDCRFDLHQEQVAVGIHRP